MEELKGLIEELLNHVDDHKEAYNKPDWTNKNIVNAWFRSHDYKFKNLGLFSVSNRRELLIDFLTSLEKGGGNRFVSKEWIVDTYLE